MRRSLSVLIIVFFAGPGFLWASPTGLNNIPTADVVAKKVLVLQAYTDVGEDNKPDHRTGLKVGPAENWEIGLDGRIFPESAQEETLVAQVKYRFGLSDDLSLGLGVSNLGDHARTGWEDPYLVCTYALGFLRLHAGGRLQRDNEGFFGGIDKTVTFFDRDLTLRADATQANDGHDATASVGFIYDIGSHFLFESWVSFSTQPGQEDLVTLKLNYVVEF